MDIVDAAQELEEKQRAEALARAAATNRPGLDSCEECGGEILAVRQRLGARLCIPHQEEAEKHARDRCGRARFCNLVPARD